MSAKKDSLGISNKEYYELLTLGKKVTRSTSKKPQDQGKLITHVFVYFGWIVLKFKYGRLDIPQLQLLLHSAQVD